MSHWLRLGILAGVVALGATAVATLGLGLAAGLIFGSIFAGISLGGGGLGYLLGRYVFHSKKAAFGLAIGGWLIGTFFALPLSPLLTSAFGTWLSGTALYQSLGVAAPLVGVGAGITAKDLGRHAPPAAVAPAEPGKPAVGAAGTPIASVQESSPPSRTSGLDGALSRTD